MTKNENAYIVGVIAEYNPLHNGHAYHIKKAKELAGAQYCIAVMSGNFVQRGAPAIYDKYTRTAMALDAGADLVLEMPSIFAVSSAEDFASCGIALLDRLGVVSSVCFGSECGEIGEISRAATILASEPDDYTETLKEQLKKGATYPQARAYALSRLADFAPGLLASPNNILGIEYVKAILRRNSTLRPLTLRRQGSGYHDTELTGGLSSASAIRKSMEKVSAGSLPDTIQNEVPSFVETVMKNGFPIFTNDFTLLLNTRLLQLIESGVALEQYSDVSQDLAARIQKDRFTFPALEDRITALKTRQYTYTRISRALLHILLGITSDEIIAGRLAGYAPYARILGFRRQSCEVLSAIKKRGTLPLITKTADAGHLLEGTAWEMFRKDLACAHLYQAVVSEKYHVQLKNEYTHSVVIKS